MLSGDRTADVVIVGAGFAGLSAAWRLLQLEETARVTVLDAACVADGAAGRNSGFMIDLPHVLTSSDYAGTEADRIQISLNRQAIGFARNVVESLRINPAWFAPLGKINGAVSARAQASNQRYAHHLEQLGEPYTLLDAADMFRVTGSRYYRAGLYTPGSVLLQPAAYVQSMADGIADRASLFENSPVTMLRRNGTDWAVHTDRAKVTAPRVILATNGHLESFGFLRGRLIQLFLYASMTPELPAGMLPGEANWGLTPSSPLGTTVRRITTPGTGFRILTRTVATVRSNMQAATQDLARATRVQRQKFDHRFPSMAGLAPAFEWAGHLCLSRNDVSVVGELDSGIFAACVQNGLGTVRGTLSGIAAAEMAIGCRSEVTRAFEAQPRPTRLPPQPFRDVAANAYIRLQERLAANE